MRASAHLRQVCTPPARSAATPGHLLPCAVFHHCAQWGGGECGGQHGPWRPGCGASVRLDARISRSSDARASGGTVSRVGAPLAQVARHRFAGRSDLQRLPGQERRRHRPILREDVPRAHRALQRLLHHRSTLSVATQRRRTLGQRCRLQGRAGVADGARWRQSHHHARRPGDVESTRPKRPRQLPLFARRGRRDDARGTEACRGHRRAVVSPRHRVAQPIPVWPHLAPDARLILTGAHTAHTGAHR